GGSVTVKVICPLRGAMFCTGPVTLLTTIGWPGATFPPLFTHSDVALTLDAVRNACTGPLPSPAAFPLTVSPAVRDFEMLKPPTKCGLWAPAGIARAATPSIGRKNNKIRLIGILL